MAYRMLIDRCITAMGKTASENTEWQDAMSPTAKVEGDIAKEVTLRSAGGDVGGRVCLLWWTGLYRGLGNFG